MTTMLQHPGSWWADPAVQWDRDAFRAAVAKNEPRWRAKNYTEADHINAIRKAKTLTAWVKA